MQGLEYLCYHCLLYGVFIGIIPIIGDEQLCLNKKSGSKNGSKSKPMFFHFVYQL